MVNSKSVVSQDGRLWNVKQVAKCNGSGRLYEEGNANSIHGCIFLSFPKNDKRCFTDEFDSGQTGGVLLGDTCNESLGFVINSVEGDTVASRVTNSGRNPMPSVRSKDFVGSFK